jgi:hypothetical protein
MFQNAGQPLTLHPDLSARNDQARREAGSCAPFAGGAGEVEPVWHALAERAGALGHSLPVPATTEDPALRLRIDSKMLDPVAVRDGCHVFVLPETAGSMRLVSRATSPDALRPWVGDSRSLGVSVRRLTVRHGDGVEVIPLDHPRLHDGWWALERDGVRHARWTNGNAELPLAVSGPAVLEVEIAALDAYLVKSRPRVDPRMALPDRKRIFYPVRRSCRSSPA